MELLVLLIALVALDLLALRFGYDSRGGLGNMAHGEVGSTAGGSDLNHEQELAREIQEARRCRLACSQAASGPFPPVHHVPAQAA
jgi:hypothetical protein